MATKKRQRSCVVCKSSAQKSELLRIVRTPEGLIEFDPTGKANGRGAYVCGLACYEKAMKTLKLNQALRCKVSSEDYSRVAEEIMAYVLDNN